MARNKTVAQKISSIFFVFTEAYGAVFLMFGALLELLCSHALSTVDPLMSALAYYAAAGFAVVALLLALYVVRKARKWDML